MISALICSISLVWLTFRKYYRAPLVTTQMPAGVSVNKIIFPAVGICSNNRISKRAITELARKLVKEERNKMYDEEGMLSLLQGLGVLYNIDPMDNEVVKPMQLHRALGFYDVNELMRNLTPRCEDLLLRCAWNDEPKNCSKLFDFRLTMNGYCCTFNYLRRSDGMFKDTTEISRSIDMYKYGNKSSFDFDQGLKILMRLNGSDDFYYSRPLQGGQLQFSDAYDFPDAPSGSFSMQIISPNVQMTVLVTASFTEASRDIQHVPVKLRQCLFYDESQYLSFYTHSDCMLKCRMSFLLANCNCTPFNMPKMPNTRTCDMRDVPCLRIYNAQSITVRPNVDQVPFELEMNIVDGGINCPMCYPTCSKTAYNYDFTNVRIYPDYLNSVPDTDRVDWLRGANFTGTSIVHVKYGREVADCYGQNVIMKWFDLISNIGSTCGFVTGFSFVSALEFVYFFTVKLWREMQKRRREKSAGNMVALGSPPYDTIKRYHSLYWNELVGPTRWKYDDKMLRQ
ncbi:PREDICTED: sodium channel protein Nach-like [Papilio xuthus]|uniref:Sodium channel protein Nach-like n=1 Tax=Papilio xuthus TaxID=66420 RepID=A0AAJ6Z375_PAPXU|nr:PREDICTED: sodium channel protein Nach-like [Papilio xuthus]